MVNNLATQATQLIYGRKKKNDVLSTSFKKKLKFLAVIKCANMSLVHIAYAHTRNDLIRILHSA
jgi:hypothetical protein